MSLPSTAYKDITWREGTEQKLRSRFAAVRIRPAHGDYWQSEPHAEEWLLIEWPKSEKEPTKYWISTLSEKATRKALIKIAKHRWIIERDYEELKQELGLGHIEGRNWRGFHHHAGLKIVCPATATDAYGLLRSAIRDPNPVVFCEHKFLYRRVKQQVATGPRDGVLVPLGKADVVREGSDLSIITYASTVQLALAVADTLEQEDVSVEVIDLRTLVPFDRDTVLDSVRKTGKTLIVHEDNLTGGFGGEVAAVIAQDAFEYLDAPVRRVAALDTPIPFAPPLEREYLPLEEDILSAARDLAAY